MAIRSHLSTGTDIRTKNMWLAAFLVILTGIIHIYIGIVELRIPLFLAGIGFFIGIGIVKFGYGGEGIFLIGAIYTMAQILLWMVYYGVLQEDAFTLIGIVDKIIQIPLVFILLYLYSQSK